MKSFYSKRVLKLLLYDKQRGKCNGCRAPFPIRKLEVDHVIPRAGGGSDIPSNFQLLCKPCNIRKRAVIAEGAQYTLFDSPREPKRHYAEIDKDGPMTAAERQRKRRAIARSNGTCGTCSVADAEPQKTKCAGCLKAAKDSVYASRDRQRSANAQKKAAQRDRAKAAGDCVVCFVTKARPGLATCKSCNEKAKARVKAARDAAKKKRKPANRKKRKP